MLDDKTMVSDALAGVNGELVRYGEMISQTENKELKACLKQLRNECRNVSGKTLPGCKRKELLCPCRKSDTAGDRPRKIRIDRTFHEVMDRIFY